MDVPGARWKLFFLSFNVASNIDCKKTKNKKHELFFSIIYNRNFFLSYQTQFIPLFELSDEN